ncbi:hypothetical protein [Methylobacter sp.]
MDAVKALHLLTKLADDIAGIYVMQGAGIVGLFNIALSSKADSLTLKAFESEALVSAKSFNAVIGSLLDQGVAALVDAVDNPFANAYLKASAAQVKTDILQQMRQDIGRAKLDLFRFVTLVKNGQAHGKTPISAAIAARQSLRFVHVDRIGRRGSAKRYVATVVRMRLVEAIYDAFFTQAAGEKADVVRLSNGDAVTLIDFYSGARNKYVHPHTKTLPIQIDKSQMT